MSDVSRISESALATRDHQTEGGQLLAQILLWAGPLTVFAMALFMAR